MWITTTTFGDYPFTYKMKKLLLVVLVLTGLQTQAQSVTSEDEIAISCNTLGLGYTTSQNLNYPFTAHASVMPFAFAQADSIYYNWAICVGGLCYPSQNMAFTLLYTQMSLTDTVKVCYDAYLLVNNTVEFCNSCDSLIFNGVEWVLLNISNPTGIEELMKNEGMYNKMYDMLGRELTEIPLGTMYIKNNKKYIKIR